MPRKLYDGRKNVTARTGLRLRRLASEMQELANRLEKEGLSDAQNDVRHASWLLGDAGRKIRDHTETAK